MKKSCWYLHLTGPFAVAAMLLGVLSGSAIYADSVLTVAGKKIEGTIVRETDDEVVLNTTDYGELSFRKVTLSSINRSSGAAPAPGGAAAPAPAPAPAGGAAPAGGGNPFAPKPAGGNPFNSGAAAPTNPPPASGGNPFAPKPAAGGNPFAPKAAAAAPSNNPTAVSYSSAPGLPAVASPAEPVKKVYNPADLPPAPSVTLPKVPIAWQGVLFGIEDSAELRLTPEGNYRSSEESEKDLYFNGPLRLRTDNTKLMAVLKNGSDYLRMNPRSQIQVLESTTKLTTIELMNGGIWLSLPTLSEERSVVVQTQNAEITATDNVVFRIADALEQGVHVSVISGEVKVVSKSAQINRTIKSGEMFLIRPEGSVSDVISVDNNMLYEDKGWANLQLDWFQTESRTTMGVGMLDPRDLVNRNELTNLIRTVGQSFMSYTEDTGLVPTDSDGYSVLLENVHNAPGWKGPYLEGIVPPVDSWGRPLRYTTKNSQESDRPIGIVYSLGEDGRDNTGNPSADITEMVLYYQIKDPS